GFPLRTPKSRIVLPNESVASNARGFWFCG
ncbi:hypothetical protein ACW694_04795, partial [Klebsiella pneumoniae]